MRRADLLSRYKAATNRVKAGKDYCKEAIASSLKGLSGEAGCGHGLRPPAEGGRGVHPHECMRARKDRRLDVLIRNAQSLAEAAIAQLSCLGPQEILERHC